MKKSLIFTAVFALAISSAVAQVQLGTGVELGAATQNTQQVIYASLSKCALNSSTSSGGGTDDTVCVQNQLNTLSSRGGGTFVEDGASLISAVNVNGITQWSALALPSNVTIFCPSPTDGFYLANSSNVAMLSNKSITGNPSGTFDTDMRVVGCTWNGNGINQAKNEENNASNAWVNGFFFAGFSGLTIDRTIVLNSKTFCTALENGSNFVIRDSTCTWNAGGGQGSAPTGPGLNHDGLHFWGPLSDGYVNNFTDHWGDDDSLAFNTNESVATYIAGTAWGYQRFTNLSTGSVALSNITIDGVYLDSPTSGVRWLSYSGTPYGTTTGTVSGIAINNVSGNISTYDMFNGCSDSQPDCAALTSPGPITMNGWYPTNHNNVNVPASSSMQLTGIIAGATLTTNSATAAQHFP